MVVNPTPDGRSRNLTALSCVNHPLEGGGASTSVRVLLEECYTKDQVDKERQLLIDLIDTKAICRLASSYHGIDPCQTFRP
ncbi:Uncharacterized protein TPAR_04857 [Tolypocladium paradoxum]|uniref:Uncharacterized protein n=1 Tax=Tolypocladium paradoxum TaxID=94208 RepID=A0A2S4KXN5_9HYPO|nr:Uncharacterized protein TPAR_04857 [Tolypocladium paradoxum]